MPPCGRFRADGGTRWLLRAHGEALSDRWTRWWPINGRRSPVLRARMYRANMYRYTFSLGRRCPSINRWRVRNVRGGLRWPRWRERKYHVGIYFVFFWLKLAVLMVIRQYWKTPILYMLYEILWVVIVVPSTQKNHVLCIQLGILRSYSTTNL